MTTYKLDELARAAAISSRTIRYYVQRGLLPAPAFRGKDTSYDDEHLVRLRAIRRLQEAYLPLDAIAAELEGKSLAEIDTITAVERQTAVPSSSLPQTPSETLAKKTYWRIEVAPGVELCVADDAPASSKALAETILQRIRNGE